MVWRGRVTFHRCVSSGWAGVLPGLRRWFALQSCLPVILGLPRQASRSQVSWALGGHALLCGPHAWQPQKSPGTWLTDGLPDAGHEGSAVIRERKVG